MDLTEPVLNAQTTLTAGLDLPPLKIAEVN